MKNLTYIAVCFILLSSAYAQNSKLGFSINVNHNLYLPRNSEHGTHYLLRIKSGSITRGGFGSGCSFYYQYNKRLIFKAGTHFSSYTYLEPGYDLRDKDNLPLQILGVIVRDHQNAWSALAHINLLKNLSLGAGLGANISLVSYRKVNLTSVLQDGQRTNMKLSDYKRVLPVIPLELSYTTSRFLWNVRLEYALINRYKKDLAKYKTEKINLLYFEVGYFIKRHKKSAES